MAYSGYRVAADNEEYTYFSFVRWYGAAAERMWETAAATEHGNATDAMETARASTESAATEHGRVATTGTAATEHSTQSAATATSVVCLSLADADRLRRNEATQPPRSLHKLARDALNAIASAGMDHASEHTENLDKWFPWKEYIACHSMASDIIGPGVTHATAEFIDGTRDPNRGGQQRLDFVVYRVDGTHCRLHPGSKRANDARPVYSSVPAGQSLATEPTPPRSRWSALPANPFTYELASTIPRIDQIGRRDACRILREAHLGPLPTTSDARFKWWLFVCNLGRNTREVFGPGITAAFLQEWSEKHAKLLFTRSDLSEVSVFITRNYTELVEYRYRARPSPLRCYKALALLQSMPLPSEDCHTLSTNRALLQSMR